MDYNSVITYMYIFMYVIMLFELSPFYIYFLYSYVYSDSSAFVDIYIYIMFFEAYIYPPFLTLKCVLPIHPFITTLNPVPTSPLCRVMSSPY